MQPIKTTNAMNPAPAKGIQSLPTPVIDDVIITEVVNAWKGDYQKLEYGTMWDSVPHGSQQGRFPEHKLVFQQVSSEDGQWVKRIWVNDRVNQDSYNYAIKYSGGSQAHPIYVRTYVLPRDGYTPLPDLTPDETYPTALLVEEEVQRNEGELDSKYIKVVRVFETLQGPEITSYRYNERGDIETVTNQQVSPETPPDPDGLLVTQSQVIKQDVSKGTKTTATVESYTTLSSKDKKAGLLGETITTDDIVDPTTQPDALSQTVVSSTVEQTTATKARKRTTTSIGPTSLTQKSKDGKLLGDITVTESVVPPGSSADSPTGTTSGILSSEIKQIDSGKAIKTNTVLNSTPTLSGNKKSAGLLGTTSTSETVVASGTIADDLTLNIISSQVDPIDSQRSRKITEISSGPNTLSGGSKKNGLLGETTITESIVSSGSLPDSLSVDIISSDVTPIDSAKSKKTTITSSGPKTLSGKESKSGLLGETTITESIVPSGSSPDTVSLSVISSEVTPIDSAKSKKTTVTATGPNSLSVKSLIDSPLGLVAATVEESIVPTSQIIENNLGTLSDKIDPLDSIKSKRNKISVQGWPNNIGVEYDEQLGVGMYYIETIVSPQEYINRPPILIPPTPESPGRLDPNFVNSDYKPLDSTKSLKKEYDRNKIADILERQYYVFETAANVTLPDQLEQVTAYFGLAGAQGFGDTESTTAGTGYSYSISKSVTSSASVSGDINFKIRKGFSGAIPAKEHTFFVKINSEGQINGSILNILNQKYSNKYNYISFKNWPVIRRTSENLVLIGGSRSRTDSKSESASKSLNGESVAESYDTSWSSNSSANSITIPESLHGTIPVSIVRLGQFPTNVVVPHFIAPSTISATSPPSFPVGEYLLSSNVELFKHGFVKVTAITVNITQQYV